MQGNGGEEVPAAAADLQGNGGEEVPAAAADLQGSGGEEARPTVSESFTDEFDTDAHQPPELKWTARSV